MAAKALARLAGPDDLPVMRSAHRKETDAYVRRWLEIAILRFRHASGQSQPIGGDEDLAKSPDGGIKVDSTQWLAGALLHEVGSKIGLVGGAAAREFANFEGSATQRHLRNLGRTFEGIVELRKASTVPKAQEFDLAELVNDIVSEELVDDTVDLSVLGRKPLTLIADQNLLRLAICNGVRNAIEAVQNVPADEERRVVITWEVTDVDYWVSVLDSGPGVSGPVEPAFEIGHTNKAGHAGFGLAIARQAMAMLGGTVELAPSSAGGASYEIRGALTR
jgi:signal transduction histidine kinase